PVPVRRHERQSEASPRAFREMTRLLKIRLLKIVSVALAGLLVVGAAQAEVAKVRVSRQFGLPYLPMIVIEAQHLLEKNAKALGIDVEAEWSQRAGPAADLDRLLAGPSGF